MKPTNNLFSAGDLSRPAGVPTAVGMVEVSSPPANFNIPLLSVIEIFGDDAIPVFKEKYLDLENKERNLQDLLDLKVQAARRKFSNHKDFDRWFLVRVLTISLATRLSIVKKELKKIRQAFLLLEKPDNKDWESKVELAKLFPVENLYPGSLKKSSKKRLVGLCCFHSEKHPSLTFYLENNSWYCYACHEGGDSISFIQKLENLDFVSAVRRLSP